MKNLPLQYLMADGAGGGGAPPGEAPPGDAAPPGGGAPPGDEPPPTPKNLKEYLPEDMAGSPSLQKFETVDALAKSYLELERSRKDYLRIPGEDAGDDQRAEFYQQIIDKVPTLMMKPTDDPEAMHQIYRQLGAPEDADGYRVPEIDSKGIQLDTSMVDTFRGVAAKNGLTQAQFEAIVTEVTAGNVEKALVYQRQQDSDRAALAAEWGAAHDERIKQIRNFAKNTGAPEALVDALNKGQISASTARWLHKIVAQTAGEGGELTRTPSGDTLLTTPQAKQQISDIMNNKQHPYWNPEMHGHEEAKKKMRDLYKLAHPGGQSGTRTVGVGSEVTFE